MTIHEMVLKAQKRDLTDRGALSDLFEICRLREKEADGGFEEAHKVAKLVRFTAATEAKRRASADMLELFRKALLFDAPHEFDAYCQYIEWDRDPPQKVLRSPPNAA